MKIVLTFWTIILGLLPAFSQTCTFHYDESIKRQKVSSGFIWAYQEKGKRTKVPTLFLHGLGGNSSHWSQNEVSGIRVDLLGYGGSSALPDTIAPSQTLSFVADQLVLFMSSLTIDQFDVVGHSMGGQIAVLLALRHPKKVRRLILLAPAGLETFSVTESTFLKNLATAEFYANQNEAQIRQGFRLNFVDLPMSIEPLIQDRLRISTCMPNYFKTVSRGVNAMLEEPIFEKLPQLKQPVLILQGKQDQLIPNRYLHPNETPEDIANLGKAIPNSQIQLVEGTGHMLMFEKPKLIDTYINTYLTKRKL